MHSYDYFKSPQGRMLLVADDKGLTSVSFIGQKYAPRIGADWQRTAGHPLLRKAKRELAEYFGGRRKRFSVKLAPHGTPFQRSVWKAIAGVGFGRTIAYAELARRAGCAGSARAAGAATGRNPIGILVPCHRIVGSNGSLTGYAGGLAKKRALLALEARR
jgi:methylated-DNA-[protein]-cysteine S-methyltransferase